MKKFIISAIAVMMVAFSANAQVWVGGSINYTNTSSTLKYDGNKEKTSTGLFSIAPEVGYNINGNWAVAASVALSFPKDGVEATLSPYARYTFYRNGIVSLFGDGGLVFDCDKVDGEKADWSYGVFVAPGIAFAVTDNFSLVTRLGGISYNWNTDKYGEVKHRTSVFSAGVDMLIPSVGLYYSF